MILLYFCVVTYCCYVNGIQPVLEKGRLDVSVREDDWNSSISSLSQDPRFKIKRMAPRKPPEPPLRILISEVDFDNVGENAKQFLELQVTIRKTGRPKTNMFEGYFVLVVDSDPLQVLASVHLEDRDYNLDPFKRYLVLGSKNVENINIDLNSPKVYNARKNLDGKNIFPSGNKGPVGFLILFQPDKSSYTDLLLFKSPLGEILPADLRQDHRKRQLIESLVTDFVVVGRRAPVSSCSWFDSLYPAGIEPKNMVILRDWEVSSEQQEHSLNRCGEMNFDGFQASLFKIGSPTPGLPNDCSGLHFNLEKSIDSFSFSESSSAPTESAVGCLAEYANIPASKYNKISDESYKKVLNKFNKSPLSTCKVAIETTTTVTETGTKEVYYPVHSLNHTYNPDWRLQCSKHLPNQGILLGYNHINSWIDVALKDNQCHFSCFYCKQFFQDGFRIDYKHKSNIMTDRGYFSKTPSHNKKAIEDHATNEIHIRAYQYGTKMKFAPNNLVRAELFEAEKAKDLHLFKPTMQVMQFLYTEIKSDVSFKRHALFMSTLSKLGLNVGFHHHTDVGAQQMMKVISEGFHEKLLLYLIKSSMPFSLIADGTTYKNIPYLVLLIQTIQDDRPVVFFYALLPIENEKGLTMVTQLKEKILKDEVSFPGFENYFKSSLVAQVSDSASNMVGKNNSFYVHLSSYVGRKIGQVRCAGHKVQLALKSAMQSVSQTVVIDGKNKTIKYFDIFGKTNNALYTFYFSRGSRRFQHLAEMAEDMNLHTKRLKKFIDIRWAASHNRAMLALKQDYDILIPDLQAIASDAAFDKKARETATNLYTQLIDKTFSVTMMEFLDILEIFQTMSLSFQQQTGLLIAKVDVIRNAIQQLKDQKIKAGKHLSTYLAECNCINVCEEPLCTLSQYDNCAIVTRKGTQMKKTDPHAIKLSEHRNSLYDELVADIQRYFPMDVLQSFDLFNPKYLKFHCSEGCSELITCYQDFIDHATASNKNPLELLQNVCKFYFLTTQECNTLKTEWPTTVGSIVGNSFLIDYQYDEPSSFWSLALKQVDVQWTRATKRLVRFILSTSFSSAEAERAFSVVTSLQFKERASLSSENLELLARLKINGPDEVDNINAFYYTTQFLKRHGRVDDATVAGGRPLLPEKFKSFFHRSDIF